MHIKLSTLYKFLKTQLIIKEAKIILYAYETII